MNIPDSKWFNIYSSKPKDGQICACKTAGENGYVGSCKYNNGYFETYADKRNRYIITRWKCDLWLPHDDFKEMLND